MTHIVRGEISREGQVGTLILELGQGGAEKGLEMVRVLAMGIQSENKRTSGLLLCSDAQEGHSAMGSLLLRTVGCPSG